MNKFDIIKVITKFIGKVKSEYSDDGQITPAEAIELVGWLVGELKALPQIAQYKEILEGLEALAYFIAIKMGEEIEE